MNNYTPIKMNELGLLARNVVEAEFSLLERKLQDLLPEYGREWSLVKTHLQTASMFMNRAIAIAHQEVPKYDGPAQI